MQIFSASYPTTLLIAAILAGGCWAFYLGLTMRRHLHWLQLEDYSPTRLFSFARRRWGNILFRPSPVAIALIVMAQETVGWQSDRRSLFETLGLIFWGLSCMLAAYNLMKIEKAAKKKLVLTPRAKRIYLIAGLVAVLAFWSLMSLFPKEWLGVRLAVPMYFVGAFASLWYALAVGLLWPQEQAAQKRYMADAQRILAEVRPLVVGITGSYGKTGTKEILAAMLADRYNVFRPPGSYNTLMGVTRAIREGLRPYHEAFVVEMGAYRQGSIARLCELVKPSHGLITIIGLQHLERFGSQKAIQKAKGELIEALPTDGIAVLNGDDPLCREIGGRRRGTVFYFSTDPVAAAKPDTLAARNVTITTTGSDFDLFFPDGEVVPVHLSLLGRAAVSNAVAAAAMADRLGVARAGIARACASIPHVRHRLEPRTGDGGVTVIDDAFNSNPIGATGALEVLAMSKGRRILVTPGMIELGEKEESANYEFGLQAAKSCDLAVLIGVNRIEPIRRGLLEGGMMDENVWIAATLTEGLERLQTVLKSGDTMLLENDLPDQYAGM